MVHPSLLHAGNIALPGSRGNDPIVSHAASDLAGIAAAERTGEYYVSGIPRLALEQLERPLPAGR
jgi:hypothetical protein